MTREQWEKVLPIVTAYVLGETVEFYSPFKDRWYEGASYDFSKPGWQYRIVKDDGTYVYFDLKKET